MDHLEFPLHQHVLPNGVQVAVEEVPAAPCVSVGIWVYTGSQEETPATNGISHFLEHMLFKGTSRRNAADIAQELEALGGQVDAFTEKELTCFHLRLLPEHLPLGLDILTDMLTGSQLAPADIAVEKNVVLEEIKHSEDTPEDLVYDLLTALCWQDHPLGLTILGTEASVRRLNRASLKRWIASHYTGRRLLVTAAGSLQGQPLCQWIEQGLGPLSAGSEPPSPPPPLFHSGSAFVEKDIEQVQLCLAWPGCSLLDEDRYGLSLLESILGGGCSSRLFQEVREKRGLAYHVASSLLLHRVAGLFIIHTASSPSTVEEVLAVILRQIADIAEKGVTESELQRAQSQMRASLLLSLEGTGARMSRLARSLLFHGRVVPLAEVLSRFERLTTAEIRRLAQRLFRTTSPSLAAVGAVTEADMARWADLVRTLGP
jgi:predicted Zn-dependent peptidase